MHSVMALYFTHHISDQAFIRKELAIILYSKKVCKDNQLHCHWHYYHFIVDQLQQILIHTIKDRGFDLCLYFFCCLILFRCLSNAPLFNSSAITICMYKDTVHERNDCVRSYSSFNLSGKTM